jgi:hypothetical protein
LFRSLVINYLQQVFHEAGDVTVTGAFCNYKERDQSALNIIGSILQQVAQRHLGISENISNLYNYHKAKKTCPSLMDFIKVLQAETRQYSVVFVVVDALDECGNDEARDDLISQLKCLVPKLRLFITTRPHIAVLHFENPLSIEIRAEEKDIRVYLGSRLEKETRIKRHIRADPSLREEIIASILERTDGM